MTADQIRSLQPALAALLEHFRCCFSRDSTFSHWEHYLTGLMSDLKRKSIEPIALAAEIPVRTLQEFLSLLKWDEDRVNNMLQRLIADQIGRGQAIGVIDASSHTKAGIKTPGVQRQYSGERGKIDNCVVGQHLLLTDNHPLNPFSCMLASDLYLPESWAEDRDRCREAGIPDSVTYRPKWMIALDQVMHAVSNGIRFHWLTFDEDYGKVPAFWYSLTAIGQRCIGEVPCSFRAWATLPGCRSFQGPHASKRVDKLCSYSPVFRDLPWRAFTIKRTTRGRMRWEVRSGPVYLPEKPEDGGPTQPTERPFRLLVARNPDSGQVKYFLSNAPAYVTEQELLQVAFSRWHVEKWFERAKQEVGLGAFEVRIYKSLIRHWMCCRMAMYFLAVQTRRLRGEKSEDHPGAGGRGDPGALDADLEYLPLLHGCTALSI